jgi:hypothetical protein
MRRDSSLKAGSLALVSQAASRDQAACDRRTGAWTWFPRDSRQCTSCAPASPGSAPTPNVSTCMRTEVERLGELVKPQISVWKGAQPNHSPSNNRKAMVRRPDKVRIILERPDITEREAKADSTKSREEQAKYPNYTNESTHKLTKGIVAKIEFFPQRQFSARLDAQRGQPIQ